MTPNQIKNTLLIYIIIYTFICGSITYDFILKANKLEFEIKQLLDKEATEHLKIAIQLEHEELIH